MLVQRPAAPGLPPRAASAALLLLCCVLALPAAPRSAPAAERHSFDGGQCTLCHPRGPTRAAEAIVGRLHPVCVKCHTPCEPWSQHSPARETGAPAGAGLPLDASGRLDCTTCHEVHAQPLPGGPRQKLLRVTNLKRELCLACHLERPPRRLDVVTPPPEVTVREREILLAGTADGSPADGLFVSLNGISYPLPLREGVFSTWLTLAEGANRVEILADGRGLWQTTVYLAAERADATAYRRLHRSHLAGRGACGACHGAERAALTGAAPEPSSDLCFRCHDRFQDKRYVHGPVAVGDCLTCHDPHGGLGEHALRDDRSALCLGCHVKGEMRLCGETADDGSPACTRCHDPHQSDARYLRKAEGPPARGR